MDASGELTDENMRFLNMLGATQIGESGSAMGKYIEGHNRLFARFITQMVAHSFDVDREVIMRPERGNAKVARVRHIAIYLMHTKLSLGLTELGLVFGKDRTTMAYACRVIEDARDELSFDARMLEFEQMLETVIALSLPAMGRDNGDGSK